MKKELRSLSDGQHFARVKAPREVIYVLQKFDRKAKTAIYTSEKSGRTFTKSWHIKVFPL